MCKGGGGGGALIGIQCSVFLSITSFYAILCDRSGIHYLPHHPVVRQDKTTTKVRVVYDACGRVRSHPSLNDCLRYKSKSPTSCCDSDPMQ